MQKIFKVSRNVFVLSIVSLLNDFAGETIKRTLPLYLVNIAGASTPLVGVIEGVAESIATLIQAPAGRLSDVIGKRKIFVLVGRLLQISRVFLILPQTSATIGLIRLTDRTGKGLGTAARDALLSDSASHHKQGAAFGFLRAFDSVGAVFGLLIAAAVVYYFAPDLKILTPKIFKIIVLIGAIPTILNVFLIAFFVKEIKNNVGEAPFFKFNLGKPFTYFLIPAALFTLGSFSEAFLILRAQHVGVPLFEVFLIIAAFSLVSSMIFLPAGILSDKLGRKQFLIFGWLIGSAALLGFALSSNHVQIWLFYLLFGVHLGATEGVARALIVDLVSEEVKATAFGVYNTLTGTILLPASIIAGVLWQTISPAAPFVFGAVTALIATILLLFLPERKVEV